MGGYCCCFKKDTTLLASYDPMILERKQNIINAPLTNFETSQSVVQMTYNPPRLQEMGLFPNG